MSNAPSGAAISLGLVQRIVGKMTKAQTANAESVVVAVEQYGSRVGLNQPHRLAQYLAQVLHESGAFKFDHELWGPTPAQKRYEGRKDLGNVQKGDGSRYRGRGPMQITGRANYRAFTAWARRIDPKAPDFEAGPEALLTDPWEGLSPIWYWDSHGLNRYADAGDIEMVTRKINGGLNGLDDRIRWLVRASLVMLGYLPDAVSSFQKQAGEKADGIAGPRTRAALHRALVALTAPVAQSKDVQAAPVVVKEKVEKPTVPETVEVEVKKKIDWWGKLTGGAGIGGLGLTGILGADWKTILAIGVVGIAAVGLYFLIRNRAVAGVREAKTAVEG